MVLIPEPAMPRYIVTASILADGRKHLSVFHPDAAGFANYKPSQYTTVRNIDGSNRFMLDGGGWSFLPHDRELEKAVEAALKALDQVLAMWRPGEYPLSPEMLTEIREAARDSSIDDFPTARHDAKRKFDWLMTPVVSKLLVGAVEAVPASVLRASPQVV